MRTALAILTAMLSTLLAFPASASIDNVGHWTRLASASDGSSTLYLLRDDIDPPNDRGWTMAHFMTTKAGPGVSNGIFAQYRNIFFNCADRTMGLSLYINFYRSGDVAETDGVSPDDIDFKAIDMGSQFGLAYQAVCDNADTSALPQTGIETVAQLIEADVAAYDAKAGQPYAY